MLPLRIAGHYDRDDVEALYQDQQPTSLLTTGFPFGCLLLSVFWLATGEPRFGLICVCVTCVGWMLFVWRRTAASKKIAINTVLQRREPIDLYLDDNGVTYTNANSQYQLGWAAFDNFEEDRHLFFLKQREHVAVAIPKRLLTAESQAALRDQLLKLFRNTNAPSVPRAFPVVQPQSPNA